MEPEANNITFDELVFCILKAVDRPLSVPEIIEHLWDWQVGEIERKGGWRTLIPHFFVKALTYVQSGAVEDALIFLCADRCVLKQYRFTPQDNPWVSPHKLPSLRQYRALSWPQKT